MAKIADRYFDINEWMISETGFDPEYSEVAESVFSLGNEYMGIRGYFDETYSGKQLIGSYLNGVYEHSKVTGPSYKGIVTSTEYMINSVNWLSTKIAADGEILDLAVSRFSEFSRKLDLRSGILTRSLVWEMKTGKRIRLEFERFLSMEQVRKGAQRIKFTSIDYEGTIQVESALDFSILHQSSGENYWTECKKTIEDHYVGIMAKTASTGIYAGAFALMSGDVKASGTIRTDKIAGNTYTLTLAPNETKTFTKLIYLANTKDVITDEDKIFEQMDTTAGTCLVENTYEELKSMTSNWWKEIWKASDIQIEGDELNQQGIRYCIFQMFQTYHGAVKGTNIGAKGLTGEAYNGNTFWDTETYCLPFYIFNYPKAAKNLLLYRYQTLSKAKERAKELDCEGAFYPIATIGGSECCSLWQHASLQLQASTGVAYGIWFYDHLMKDQEFLAQYGAKMLVEISRMLISRGDYNADGTKFGYYSVMGPDEFQMMVNHNCYTNLMAKFTLNYTCEVLEQLKNTQLQAYESLVNQLALTVKEVESFHKIAEDMLILYDDKSKLFEQHDGFFKLPHVDVHKIPIEDFPLYNHWSYDRIYRNDMIKQPDVLMFLFLFNSSFTNEQIKANYEYYEPRCIHESSLSPSVHSILASQLKKNKEAYDFFSFATRMDLDNYNRNTKEGLHTTSIAAAWMNIVYGFGGMRSDNGMLRFNPTIPAHWTSYHFCVKSQNDYIAVTVDKDSVHIHTHNGSTISICVYEKEYDITGKETKIMIPKEWMDDCEGLDH